MTVHLFGATSSPGVDVFGPRKLASDYEHVSSKAKTTTHLLARIRGYLKWNTLQLIYTIYIRPVLEYGSLTLSPLSSQQLDTLERLQRRAVKVCLRLPIFQPSHHSSLLHQVALPTLTSRRSIKQVMFAHAMHHHHAPPHIASITSTFQNSSPRQLRHSRTFSLPVAHTTRFACSPIVSAMHKFNALPADLRSISDPISFKDQISLLLASSICSCSNTRCSPI